MRGGLERECFHDRKNDGGTEFTILRKNPSDFDSDMNKKINDKEILSLQSNNPNNIQKKNHYKKFLVTFATGNWVRLGKGTKVEIQEIVKVQPDKIDQQQYKNEFGIYKAKENVFGSVIINGVQGWVNMKYMVNLEGRPCFEEMSHSVSL